MDRISLTWDAALADPPTTVAHLKGHEVEIEAYLVRLRTLRQWLENVPPFSAMGTYLPTIASDDDPGDGDTAEEQSPRPDDNKMQRDGAASAGPQDNRPADAGEAPAQPTTTPAEAVPGEEADMERDKASEASVPPPRAPAGNQGATAKPHKGQSGRQQRTTPPAGEQLTLHQRVEAALERFRPGAPLTVRNVAVEIGHSNVRSLRPVLDRIAEQGLLVKTELHPRAVVYHRPEAAGSPTREATMF